MTALEKAASRATWLQDERNEVFNLDIKIADVERELQRLRERRELSVTYQQQVETDLRAALEELRVEL